MIRKEEIREQALLVGLPPNIVEKDYVLSWILAGISAVADLRDNWVFKGGTCLKKCYFEQYRFSEDLDYTLIDQAQINVSYLSTKFQKIIQWVNVNSGIELSNIKFEEYINPQGNPSIEGKIEYRGPMARRGDAPKIKLDLTADELMVFPPEKREVYHSYSDIPVGSLNVSAYCIEEIFSEKIRAMVQRLRPRDLFDVINLYEDKRWSPDNNDVLNALRKKCTYKNVDLPTLGLLNSMRAKDNMIESWEQMLAHQISDLPPYQHYWDKLPQFFEWLYQP